MGHQVIDIGTLRHGAFQEFQSGRCIIENVSAHDGGSVRCTDLLAFDLSSAVDHIFDPGKGFVGLGDHFRLSHCGNGGESFAAESQGFYSVQVFDGFQLRGGMTKKGLLHLLHRDPDAVIRHTDHGDPAILDLYGDPVRLGIDGVFHQFLYDGCRPFDHFACRDLVYGFLVKYMDHAISSPVIIPGLRDDSFV